jgi:tight adherence protein B
LQKPRVRGAGTEGGRPTPSLRDALNERARALRRYDAYRSLETSLQRAGWPLKPIEYAVVVLLAALALGGIAWALTGAPLAGAAGVVAGVILAQGGLQASIGRRMLRFEQQLPDALELMAASLRSGHGFQRALQVTADDMPAPVSTEFRLAVQDISVGQTVEEALRGVLLRVPSYEMELLATAVGIQMNVGGNLSEVLDKIAGTLRERQRIRGEIASLTAEGRLTAWLVFAAPIVMFAFMTYTNPDYMKPLTQEASGHMMLFAAAVMELLGVFAIWRLLQMEV